MKANVDHMIELIAMANGFGGSQDLVCFHEQPIMGWNPWTREETLRVSVDVPGTGTERLGKKAKECGCYITFGTYPHGPDWPGHELLNGILIDPDGNIACSITPFQPDVARALAMKGMELRLSSASGGYNVNEAEQIARHNGLWSIVCNQSLSPEQPGVPAFSGSGDTAIFAPDGSITRARSVHEEFVRERIPIAEFRRTRSITKWVPIEMLLPVYRPIHRGTVPIRRPHTYPRTRQTAPTR